MMNVECKDRERILEDGTPADWAELEAHAGICASCAQELRSWKALSMAAAEMRDYTDSPALWPRIHEGLVEQAGSIERQKQSWDWRSLFANFAFSWQAAAATAFVVVLMLSAAWVWRSRDHRAPEQGSLLRSKALVDVEHAESAYVQAIDKLAVEAKPQLQDPATPLMANYREKLMVVDSAIDDLRAQTGQNPSNAHLRYQLLAMYQEKQRTLEEILGEKR
jgi:anti-sigma-K factor RskA